jgi:hypothetical protein
MAISTSLLYPKNGNHSLGQSTLWTDTQELEKMTRLIRKRIVLDAGNRFIKWLDPQGRVRCIPSYVLATENWQEVTWDDESVVVEVDGKKYVIGKIAKELGGKAIFSESKTDWAWLLGYVALEPNLGENTLTVEELVYFLPDTRHQQSVEGVKKIETFASAKEFRRNGVDIVATVRRVIPTDETRGAYCYAIRNGLFNYPQLTNGVVNIGGGDISCHVYLPNLKNPERAIIDRDQDLNLKGKGTAYLAEKIAAAVAPMIGERPSADWIMDGIADGSFTIAQTGTYFKPQFDAAQDVYCSELRGRIKTEWSRALATMGEVLVVGGSATLVKPIVDLFQGRWRIPAKENMDSFSQFIDIYGMAEIK